MQAARDLGIRYINRAGEVLADEAEMPVLDEPTRLFVTKVLQQKCVKVELAEGQEKINVLKDKNDKWEKRRTKFNLKANAKVRMIYAILQEQHRRHAATGCTSA